MFLLNVSAAVKPDKTKDAADEIELSRDSDINITNNLDKKIELYIYNLNNINPYKCNINVRKGEVLKINNNTTTPIPKTADNILYSIDIEVKKDSKVTNIEGSTIFKYIPNNL